MFILLGENYLPNIKLDNHWLVVCFCAKWCSICLDYYQSFKNLGIDKTHNEIYYFIWVDIEDYASYLEELDIKNFPTILIQCKGKNIFYGHLASRISHLKKLLVHLKTSLIYQSYCTCSLNLDFLKK